MSPRFVRKAIMTEQAVSTVSTNANTTMPAATEAHGGHSTTDQRAESLREQWQSLHLLCTAFRAQANRMATAYGLSNSQFTVFTVLSTGEPMTMGQIGERSDPSSSLTALVDRLVELGIASRQAHPFDRRAIQIQLTESGHELAERVSGDTLRSTAQITAGLGAAQIIETTGAIQHLLAGYDQYVIQVGRTQARSSSRRSGIGRPAHVDTLVQPHHAGGSPRESTGLPHDPLATDLDQ